jgi:apolipoprotein D and lipocalin family protein
MMILATFLVMTAAASLPTQDGVDLARYSGRWYEIARLPNRFQESCARDVVATYTLRPDGRVDVLNECQRKDGEIKTARGVARRADEKGPASRLKVRFAPAFLSFLSAVWGDYWIVELDRDYRHVIVGEPSRKYLWILSRTPRMDSGVYDSLVARARTLGFDTERILRTEQSER